MQTSQPTKQEFTSWFSQLPGVPQLYDISLLQNWSLNKVPDGHFDDLYNLYVQGQKGTIETEIICRVKNALPNVDVSKGFPDLPNIGGLNLYDNLQKNTSTPSHRSMPQGNMITIKVPTSENGYLYAAIYEGKTPTIVRCDGMPGNGINGQPDTKDGIVNLPTTYEAGNQSLMLPKGTYTLHVEASASIGGVPKVWDNEFDIN